MLVVRILSLSLLLAVWLAGMNGATARDSGGKHGGPRVFEKAPPPLDRKMKELKDKGVTPRWNVAELRLWRPGQTVTVAFRGGSERMRKQVADLASEWCRYGNLKLDFGYDGKTGKYREWSPEDKQFAADIRVAFENAGHWSLIGTMSSDPEIIPPGEASMNLDAEYEDPAWLIAAIRHEFGHALGFLHEHQHPLGQCNDEFKWQDDPGYVPTKDRYGTFIADASGKRPGLYTYMSGAPNGWDKEMVDHNMRYLADTRAYGGMFAGPVDRTSIMHYTFPDTFFKSGDRSKCYCPPNFALSAKDQKGMNVCYPPNN